MKNSKLGKFKWYRWFTSKFLGWKWSKGMNEEDNDDPKGGSRKMIPKIWSPRY